MTAGSICLVPVIQSVTGPASFQLKLKAELEKRGFMVHHDPQRADTEVILVIAASRHISSLLQARRRGVRIVQRLNGINWIHRKRPTGVPHFIRAELRNLLLLATRQWVADQVVYQSEFARSWWRRVYGPAPCPESVILNGIDLTAYSPLGPEWPPEDHVRIQVVEGHLAGGYEIGLDFALHYAASLQQKCGQRVEVVVAGQASQAVQTRAAQDFPQAWVNYAGVVPRDRIPVLQRAAHLFFSAELNASCPNSVIEALACGCPTAAFAAGALPELVSKNAGCLAPYGGDPWKLDLPNFEGLASISLDILSNQPRFRSGARAQAEAVLSIEKMTDAYLMAMNIQTKPILP